MRPTHAAGALVAGIAAFLTVGVIVTELVAPAIEFSVFLGLPTGLLAGVVVLILTYRWLAPSRSPTVRRPALAAVAFGVVFLIVLLGAVGGLGLRNSIALLFAGATGVGAAAATALGWKPNGALEPHAEQ